MKSLEKSHSFSSFLVLTVLWTVNILILFFGFPFLIFKKIREIFSNKSKKTSKNLKTNPANYLPPQIDSEF